MSFLNKIRDMLVPHHNNNYILTGGPGVGKSCIIHQLQKCGHQVIHEAATDIIREGLTGGNQAPWTMPDFNERILQLQENRQLQAASIKSQYVFFDRSPLDTLTYCLIHGHLSLEPFNKSVKQLLDHNYYQKTVFLIENLGFCKQDEVRPETLDQCLSIERKLEETYKLHGFKIVRIPALSVSERADLILKHIQAQQKLGIIAKIKHLLGYKGNGNGLRFLPNCH